MSIRLSKAIKNLNVGLSTAVDFLKKQGHEDVPEDINFKISDEQYLLLAKEFDKDKALKIESDRLNIENQQKEKKETVALEGYKAKQRKEEETIKAVESIDLRPRLVKVGHIDLDDIKAKTKKDKPSKEAVINDDKEINELVETSEDKNIETVESKNIEVAEEKSVETIEAKTEAIEDKITETVEKLPNEEISIPEEVKTTTTQEEDKKEIKEEKEPVILEETKEAKQDKEAKSKKKTKKVDKPVEEEDVTFENETVEEGDELFRLGSTKITSAPVVVGSIDLDSINQSTRPKSKTKEQKRKEREERYKKDSKQKRKIEKEDNAEKDTGKQQVKRKRIDKQRVDISNPAASASNAGKRKPTKRDQIRKPLKAEVSEEDVQKQIKETLARLSNTGRKQGRAAARYRRDKREQASARQQEIEKQERREESVLKITEFVTVSELATMMDISVNDVISTCMSVGMMVSINQRLDAETINIVAEEFGYKTDFVSHDVIEALVEEEDKEEDLVSRAPIVTVMGHVDHGKTSLLDYIRNANVIAGEAGGITQHIGAYNVKLDNGQRITFLDTPGHEAFTAMRARGAKVTDIAIIIVAADDSVMPQTVEAINHASAAGVPIVFAINKVDKPTANPEKIKEALAAMNYLVEDWGGKYQSQEISAKKGTGVKELLEKILLESEILDLKANPNRRAIGSIVESSLDKGRGYISTVLVENGTLKQGDIVLAGTHHGRIKAMFNERNQRIEEARPSEPVLVLGLDGAPQAGDTFNVVESEQEAKDITNKREQLQREQSIRTKKHFTLDELGRRIALGDFKELNIIVKGDVDGSVEALSDSLIKLSTENIQVNVIHKAVGAISDSDVMLATASDAIIIGFQVRPTVSARKMAENEEIDIRMYSIIYDAIEEIKMAMEGMLSPVIKEEITATIEVLDVFKISKVGSVAGCVVREGKVKRNNKLRLIRDGIVIYTGELDSLKRFKEDVREVGTNFECGLSIRNYNDIKVGDLVETFEEVEVKQSL